MVSIAKLFFPTPTSTPLTTPAPAIEAPLKPKLDTFEHVAKKPTQAEIDAFKLINALGTEARKLKAELAASPANATIDDQSTSESMSLKAFKLFSKSSKFSSQVLGKAFAQALKGGTGAGEFAGLADDLKRALLRSKDSSLTAGERHQASQHVADAVIALQEAANKKAYNEAKKAIGKLL